MVGRLLKFKIWNNPFFVLCVRGLGQYCHGLWQLYSLLLTGNDEKKQSKKVMSCEEAKEVFEDVTILCGLCWEKFLLGGVAGE